MNPYVLNIEYQDPELVLLKLADEPGLCFLDSSKPDKLLGRYSYIAVDPFEVIKSKNEHVSIGNEKAPGNPFDCLSTRLLPYKSEPIDDLPPFQGGAVGYFGYDLLHHLESIPQPAEDIIAVPDMMIGLYDLVVAFDHIEQSAWIISQGFPEISLELRQERALQRAERLRKKLSTKNIDPAQWSPSNSLSISSSFKQAEYCQAVQKTIDYIYAGDIFQANISQCFSSDFPKNLNPIYLYTALRKQNPAPFAAFIRFDDICIASASPERFISLNNGKIQTRPIKGTRPRGDTPEADIALADELVSSPKDLAENTMIVDLMRNDLSRVSKADSVKVTQLCELESYQTVHHLVSVVEAELHSDLNAIDLMKACFPGGSITGAPKIRAMEIIYEIERSARGVYCGSIGYIGFDGNMDTSIVIRTYTINGEKIYFQAGGGIVADSVPETEYQESLTKASALKKVLLGEEVSHDPAH